MLYNPFLQLEWCGKSTRNDRKYGRFGRFQVVEPRVIQYNMIKAPKVNPHVRPARKRGLDFGRAKHNIEPETLPA